MKRFNLYLHKNPPPWAVDVMMTQLNCHMNQYGHDRQRGCDVMTVTTRNDAIEVKDFLGYGKVVSMATAD